MPTGSPNRELARLGQLDRKLLAFAANAAARSFPREDHGVLARQLRRAAFGISATIAEGCGKSTRPENLRYLQMAAASAREVEDHLISAHGVGYIRTRRYQELIDEIHAIQNMIYGLIKNFPED